MTFARNAGLKWLLLGGLLLALAILLSSSRAAAAACGGSIKMGDQTSDWIERAGTSCEYTFEGQARQEVTIAMIGVTLDDPSLDVYLVGSRTPLKECVKTQPSRSRSLANGPEARVTCNLSRGGTYRIVAARGSSSRTGSGTGQFVLNVCGTHIANPYEETLKEFRTGQIAGGSPACYSFRAQSGDCVTAAMNKDTKGRLSTLDPWLDLRDPTGATIASDDNSNGGKDALIRNLCVKKTGLYTIIARSSDRKGAGSFTFYFTLRGAQALH